MAAGAGAADAREGLSALGGCSVLASLDVCSAAALSAFPDSASVSVSSSAAAAGRAPGLGGGTGPYGAFTAWAGDRPDSTRRLRPGRKPKTRLRIVSLLPGPAPSYSMVSPSFFFSNHSMVKAIRTKPR